MPAVRGKRKIAEFRDPNKSDSEDETYGTSVSKPSRSRPSKSQPTKGQRKKQRTKYSGDDSEDDDSVDESELSVEVPEPDSEDEEVELGPSGRPKRKAAPRKPIYEESGSEVSEEEVEPEEDEEDEEEEEDLVRPKRGKSSLIVKLKVNSPMPTPAPSRRSTRARSGSVTTSRPSSSHMAISNTRRSSRIAHDETETVVALTNSGNYVDIVGPRARSSSDAAVRPTRGGKGLKKPPSVVDEESLQNSGKTNLSTDELQRADPQAEVAASLEDLGEEAQELEEQYGANSEEAMDVERDEGTADVAIIPESGEEDAQDEDDEDPISQPGRTLRRRDSKKPATSADEAPTGGGGRSTRRSARSTLGKRKTRGSQRGVQESSDFEPGPEECGEEDVSDSAESTSSPRKASQNNGDESSPGRRGAKRRKGNSRSRRASEDSDEVADELAEELDELRGSRRRRAARAEILYDARPKTRRHTKPVDYRIINPDLAFPIEEDDGPAVQSTPSRRNRGGGGGWQRSLFSTYGPFGGAGGPPPVFGGPGGIGAAAGADSDSSDDETMQRPRAGIGGAVGMTPTTAHPGLGLIPPPAAQGHGADPVQGPAGTPANLGKVKDKQALADADPLGVDQNVTFDGVGGLQGHIDQLKEMVALPLLYPEVFQRFHVTPPRGVLFHGPPGTGKTLLARALASSVSSQGRKVTFYMRKGADALSKWVGEAERQLRLLFEEARKNQPSIIFFDEIDGLAPVRSSKQEQIHASIVSTLLALMDGMDGRGQVIVIGATNRPDSVDPALRRPGRFDREFYFPLPNLDARRAILDIHTKGWNPPLESSFKDEIAYLTKGYGGADLRALCTEAALNAVQRRYPQIYKSNEKLQIKPETINIAAKDFMISVKKMVPSSERSASSGAAPLPTKIEPLLRQPLKEIENLVADIIPQKKRLTALQEAEFEDAEDDRGMKAERMQQEFERSRVFRPRLLIRGVPGMGQQYLAGALLNHFEGLHVQAFDLPTLLSDSTRSSEAAIVQLFTEVRRHKPSVIYIPNVDVWYRTVGQAVISTFVGLLRSLSPTDPVLLLGILECEEQDIDEKMIKDLFGYSRKSLFEIGKPTRESRHEYFNAIVDYLTSSPTDFPEPTDRKKRTFEILIPVPPEPPKPPTPPTKAELKAQKKKDRLNLNTLKLRIQPIMDQIKLRYKKFRTGVIEENQIRYLYDEDDPTMVTTDLLEHQRQLEYRPFEKATDDHGEPGLKQIATGKFFYNLETVTIEKRLSNGYYKRPKDFTSDIKKLTKDAKTIGDDERLIKANELQANVEVDMENIGVQEPWLVAELEHVYAREVAREKEMMEKARQAAAEEGRRLGNVPTNVPPGDVGASSTDQSSGPVVLGQPLMNGVVHHPTTPSNHSHPSALTNGVRSGLSDLSDLHGHDHSAGNSGPSRGSGDVHMTNSDDVPSGEKETQSSSFGPSAQTRPPDSYTGGPISLQQRRSIPGSMSQRSAVTPMAEGASILDYANYASTTSSDKRHTGSSGDKNTQSTNGKADGPDLGGLIQHYQEPGSQVLSDTVADTQGKTIHPSLQYTDLFNTLIETPLGSQLSARQNSNGSNHSSSPHGQHQLPQQERLSQNPAVPIFPRENSKTTISSLLNNPPAPSAASTVVAPQRPPLVLDNAYTSNLIEAIVHQTSGCSVEQLEQVYSALMSEIWRTRGEWNRGKVAREVGRCFEEVMDDIRYMQDLSAGSVEIAR